MSWLSFSVIMDKIRRNCVTCLTLVGFVTITAWIFVTTWWLVSSARNSDYCRSQSLDKSHQTVIMQFSRDYIMSFRRNCHLQPSDQAMDRIHSLGIARTKPWSPSNTRGCRGGRNKTRKIKTVISNRSRYSFSQCTVNHNNLISVPLQPLAVTKSKVNCTVSLVNTRSVRNKTSELMDCAIDSHSDICVLTETWLTNLDNVPRAALKQHGFNFQDFTRQSARRGGGTGILYKDSLRVSKQACGENNSFEYSEWLVTSANNRVKLCVIYRPPYSEDHPVSVQSFFTEFEDYLESIVLSNEPICIMGDFNIHMDKSTCPDQHKLMDILNSFGLIQHVNIPTHQSGHTLDLIITRNSDDIILSNPYSGDYISDHCFITTQLTFPKPGSCQKLVQYRKLKSMDLDSFKLDLQDICNDLMQLSALESMASEYYCRLKSCLDKHAPVICKVIHIHPNRPWYTPSLKEKKVEKRKAEKLWRESEDRSIELLQKCHQVRNQYSYLLKQAVTDHYSDAIICASGDQKALYKIVDSLTNITRDNPLPPSTSASELANDFGDFFIDKVQKIRHEIDNTHTDPPTVLKEYTEPLATLSSFTTVSEDEIRRLIMTAKPASCDLDPIPTSLLKECVDIVLPIFAKLINTSLDTGTFPDCWKTALVIPLLKKCGLEQIFKNYRPVSNLPFISKITEKAVINQVRNHMDANCPLPICQSAYRPRHSTETALIKIQSDILDNMEHQKVTILVLIDLSAAFDTVDCDIQCDVLSSIFGTNDTVLSWFRSYLTNRKLKVNINGSYSETFDLQCGVPQGSCLGPVLFTQYASTIFNIVDMDIHGYADDHQLYLAFSPRQASNQVISVATVENCLSNVKRWMVHNKLQMNNPKTECLIIGTRQQLDKVTFDSINVNGTVVKAVDNVRNLGAYLDRNMSMCKHIDVKCHVAFGHLFNIIKIRKYLTKEATTTLAQSFVFNHLDYCNSLLYGLPDYQIRKFQRIQNMAAKIVFQARKCDHVTPLLKELHWLPVYYRITFKVLLYTFKGVHKLAPQYICDMFRVRHATYSLRSASSLTLDVPKTKCKTLKDRSLPVAGPVLWNSLPSYLRDIVNFDLFKKNLKTYLFNLAFN